MNQEFKNNRIPSIKPTEIGSPTNLNQVNSMFGENHLINRLYVHWDINTKCNFKCSYCYAMRDYLPRNLWSITPDFSKTKLIIKSLEKSTLPIFLGLLGGEPTLHPKFLKILEILNNDFITKHKDNRIYITSNLSTKIFNKIPYYKNNKYLCSIHFEYRNSYGEDFEVFFKNLEILLSKGYTTRVNLLLIPSKQYWQDIHKVYKKLKEYEEIQIHPHFLYYDPCENTSLFDYKKDFYNEFQYMSQDKDFIYKNNDKIYLVSDIEIFENHLNRFKGWQCYNNNYEINVDGSVRHLCKKTRVSLLENPLFFKKIKEVEPMTCPYFECNCDGLLKIYKTKSKSNI